MAVGLVVPKVTSLLEIFTNTCFCNMMMTVCVLDMTGRGKGLLSSSSLRRGMPSTLRGSVTVRYLMDERWRWCSPRYVFVFGGGKELDTGGTHKEKERVRGPLRYVSCRCYSCQWRLYSNWKLNYFPSLVVVR